jgi:hypothetical protein
MYSDNMRCNLQIGISRGIQIYIKKFWGVNQGLIHSKRGKKSHANVPLPLTLLVGTTPGIKMVF